MKFIVAILVVCVLVIVFACAWPFLQSQSLPDSAALDVVVLKSGTVYKGYYNGRYTKDLIYLQKTPDESSYITVAIPIQNIEVIKINHNQPEDAHGK